MKCFLVLLVLLPTTIWSQQEIEIQQPFNIKTISFVQNGQNVLPFFRLGDSFSLIFDDLYGDEANYYYTLTHCDYNWDKSALALNEYISGFDNQRIINYENSFNTLQLYSHYQISFPNQFTTQFKVSGNYIIKILNSNNEVVFSRKFILYENQTSVAMQVKTARDTRDIDKKHNIEFKINANPVKIQNPIQNIKILLLKNGDWNTSIKNIKPLFTIGNDLIYKYDKETQFWAGNEYLFYENKDVRNAVNNIKNISLNNVYNTHLYTNAARANNDYTFFPDANGIFIPQNINAENNNIQADYTWVYFSLSAPSYFLNKDLFITGNFNNNMLKPEYKLEFNKDKNIYEKAIFIKQGLVNYQFTIADSKGNIDDENAIDGNFYQTENNYFCFVYYKGNNDRYDRVIGKGVANSENIIR